MGGADSGGARLGRRRFLGSAAGGIGALALSGFLAGCGTGSTSVVGAPRRTVALADNFGPFDPITATTIESVVLNYHVFEGLVDLDQTTRELYPALAADWPVRLDPLTYRIRL